MKDHILNDIICITFLEKKNLLLTKLGVVAWMDKQFLIDLLSSPRIQAQNEMNLCAVL